MHCNEPWAQQSLLGSPEAFENAEKAFTDGGPQIQKDLMFQVFHKEEVLETSKS